MVTIKTDLVPGQRVFFWSGANGKKELLEVVYLHPLEDSASGEMPRLDLLNAANAVKHVSQCDALELDYYTLADNAAEQPVHSAAKKPFLKKPFQKKSATKNPVPKPD